MSHDLDEAFKLGNNIAIMEGGHIVQTGTPQDIFNKPENDYVADFVQHMNPLGVLRIRDVMKACTLEGTYEQTLNAEVLLKDAMALLVGTNKPLGVIRGGKIIGELSKDDLLAGLAIHK